MSRHIIFEAPLTGSKGNYIMDSSLAQRAIDDALTGNWEGAIKTNLTILKESPNDIDSLNRLSRAYAQLGFIPKAKATAKKALKIDSLNPIAKKALAKFNSLKDREGPVNASLTGESFLEEPGKTKLVSLIHPGDEVILASLNAGDAVALLPHPHRVSVVTGSGKYIGRLPDDLAARLRRMIKAGNKYQVLIKSVEGRDVKVFIRGEVASFPTEKIDYISFTPPELVHKETPEIPMSEEII